MIQIYECPSCGRDSAAFAELKATGKIVCPACAPVPDKEPHDYYPIMVGGLALNVNLVSVTLVGGVNLISGVCCGDAGDCGHECGVA